MEWGTIDRTDSIDLRGVDLDAEVEWRKDIELNPNDENLSEVYFEHFFPCAKGHAKLVDECNSSRR